MPDAMPAAPHGAALLIIDMINDFDFDQADDLMPWLDGIAGSIGRLRDAADAAGVPVVYVNDNYDLWHSDRDRIIAEVSARSRRPELVARLCPRADDYLASKPRFSGFYATNLPVLLPRLGATRLILTGVAADVCVLFTAADAYMRQYGLWVPADATACHSDQRRDWALEVLREAMHAETRPTSDLPLAEWLAQPAPERTAG